MRNLLLGTADEHNPRVGASRKWPNEALASVGLQLHYLTFPIM